jgi:hypothetical protein
MGPFGLKSVLDNQFNYQINAFIVINLVEKISNKSDTRKMVVCPLKKIKNTYIDICSNNYFLIKHTQYIKKLK